MINFLIRYITLKKHYLKSYSNCTNCHVNDTYKKIIVFICIYCEQINDINYQVLE